MVTLAHPCTSSSLQIPDHSFHIISATSFQLLCSSLAPTTLTPTRLFLHLPPHFLPLTHHSHHPSLLCFSTQGSKPTCSTNRFYPRLPFHPLGLTPRFLAGHHFFLSVFIYLFSSFLFLVFVSAQ